MRVSIRQIFGSHSNTITEGTYVFAPPTRGVVSDFAIWDGLVRIPGVILERRAEEICESLKTQAIVPIPAFGTKRIEMEYYQRLAVENLRSAFVISLKPDPQPFFSGNLASLGELRVMFLRRRPA